MILIFMAKNEEKVIINSDSIEAVLPIHTDRDRCEIVMASNRRYLVDSSVDEIISMWQEQVVIPSKGEIHER